MIHIQTPDMVSLSNLICFSILASILVAVAYASTFEIRNQCPYTVWAAAVPGGGQQLNPGQAWTINIGVGVEGRVWGRTNCLFDGSGKGSCQTGDCNGRLQCKGFGKPPNTIAEYALNLSDDLDFFAMTLEEGFNIPMVFSGCSSIKCNAKINEECPNELRAPGGCNNPCTVYKTNQYCCKNSVTCGATPLSKFFKDRCPQAYSHPKEDQSSSPVCSSGTNYRVIFCP